MRIRQLLKSRDASAAAEFALVTPILILVTIGTVNLCALLLAFISLHFAVEDAARCATAKIDICFDPATTAAYGDSRYTAPGPRPAFVHTTEICGNRVTGTVNYRFDTGLTRTDLPLNATACFPVE